MHPLEVYRNWRSRLSLIDSWGVAPTDRVLEVGSGQNPNPRADVLCERFLSDGLERHHHLPVIDRPFVVGDIYRLPFRDRAFDFVICSHVLEHLGDPTAALAELSRVAPRGYVETPSRVNEKLISYPFHKWYVHEEAGTMVFQAKERAVHDEELGEWMRRLGETLPGWQGFFHRNAATLGNVVGRVWEGSQPSRVEGRPPEAPDEFSNAAGQSLRDEARFLQDALDEVRPGGAARRLYTVISRRLRRRSTPGLVLDELLACPACGASVDVGQDEVACGCGIRYPVVQAPTGPIPFLVEEGS